MRWLAVPLLGFALAGCGPSLSPMAASTFDAATQFVVMQIDPEGDAAPGADVFAGHRILARAEVTDAGQRHAIRALVDSGLRRSATPKKCFNPRRAIHATLPGHVVDALICFECSSIEISEDGQTDLRPFGDVAAELDRTFAQAGLKLTK